MWLVLPAAHQLLTFKLIAHLLPQQEHHLLRRHVTLRRWARGVRSRMPAQAACLPTLEMAKSLWHGINRTP